MKLHKLLLMLLGCCVAFIPPLYLVIMYLVGNSTYVIESYSIVSSYYIGGWCFYVVVSPKKGEYAKAPNILPIVFTVSIIGSTIIQVYLIFIKLGSWL